MTCFNPQDAWLRKVPRPDGKQVVSFVLPVDSFNWYYTHVPCGRCIGCRLDNSRSWAIRCMHELEYYQEACFVTLTYSNFSLPQQVDCDTGELRASIFRSDVVKFVKLLRKHIGSQRIKVYYCGEYGSKRGRPHYHLIIFGYRPKDLTVYKTNEFGNILYNSKELEACWYDKVRCPFYGIGKRELKAQGLNPELFYSRKQYHNIPKGHIVIADVSFDSCAYVARYILKKQKKNDEIYEIANQEFVGSSNGIGKQWFMDNYRDMYAIGYVVYDADGKRKKAAIPRYYTETLLPKVDPDLYEKVKNERFEYMLSKCFDELNYDDLMSNNKCLEFKNEKLLLRRLENESICSL